MLPFWRVMAAANTDVKATVAMMAKKIKKEEQKRRSKQMLEREVRDDALAAGVLWRRAKRGCDRRVAGAITIGTVPSVPVVIRSAASLANAEGM